MSAPLHFDLAGRSDGVDLGPETFEHPRWGRSRRRVRTRYADLTHLALSRRFVWIGAKRVLTVLPRSQVRDAPALLGALLERVEALPGGAAQLARMEQVEALARRPVSRRATLGLLAVCAVGYALELAFSPEVFTVGHFSRPLVADGDWWRLLTANLLHGFGLHLALNLIGLWVLGRHVERALGSARTVGVMGAAALGSMAASGLFLEGAVVGVSGVVFGLAGAMIWLELACSQQLPAWWRLPRHFLVLLGVAFAGEMLLGFALPIIAGEAHLGGLLAGAVAAAALTRSPLAAAPGALPRRLAGGLVAATAVSVLAAAAVLLQPGDPMLAHAARLVRLPDIPAADLNNHAWEIAIDPESGDEALAVALELAERAVAESAGREASILDTLAEVQFQLGWPERAVGTIERAIERDPVEPYYREQRRRFLGERAADDRPPDPALRPRRPPLDDADGITV